MTRARQRPRGSARGHREATGGRGSGSAAAAARIRFFPNDPDAPVGLKSAAALTPEGREPAFTIEGRRYAPAPYDPGTLAFQYWQGEVALARTIHMWEDLFERDFTQWHDDRPLRVRLRAGKDLNAFYDRKSLQFFYDVDRKTRRTVYAAESVDVVAHEAGHAVLDVYQPGYWSTPDLETASFHEAFADCSALLVTLTDAAVRRALLEEADGAWGKSNQVSRLAEALGRAIHDNYGEGAVSDPTRLRDTRNDFRYAQPETLRPGTSDEDLAPEPHSFSRVFTGAFYDVFIWLLSRGDPGRAPEAAVERARLLSGRLLARAIETIPPGAARYRDIGARMREIDQSEQGGVATIGIEKAFARHGMPLEALLRERRIRGKHAALALRALDPDRPGGLGAIRAALRLPAGAKLARRATPLRRREGSREQLLHIDEIPVRHRSLGKLSGLIVRVPCGCTLTRGVSGEILDLSLAPHPHPEPRDLLRSIRVWVRLRAIDPTRGSRSAPREFFLERKPFRLTAEGLLERVYFD